MGEKANDLLEPYIPKILRVVKEKGTLGSFYSCDAHKPEQLTRSCQGQCQMGQARLSNIVYSRKNGGGREVPVE